VDGSFREWLESEKKKDETKDDQIIFPQDIKDKLNEYAKEGTTLSLFHNHPWSIAPSRNDYETFFKYKAIKNSSVCGHVGNLYFVQKSEGFYEMSEKKRLELETAMIGIFWTRVIDYMDEYENEYKTDYRNFSDEIRKQFCGRVQGDLFAELKAKSDENKYNLQFYREGD